MADQANSAKRYSYDGLGRLKIVIEDPGGLNYGTNYFYDEQDDLIWVSQGYCPNCQNRTFTYDAVGRLIAAANPESGTVNYGYDGAGNLISKTDERQRTTCYGTLSGAACISGYDALNRVTNKSYSDGTPAVTYTYDTGAARGIGRLTKVENANSATAYTEYDEMGRVKQSRQQTNGQTYGFQYTYNLAGALMSETYPSLRTVSTIYGGLNQPNSVTGSLNGQSTGYITQAAYWPHGEIYYYVRGNGVWHAASYNSRLQQTESYEAINNNSDQMLLVACPNRGWNSNAGVYDICPHASATNDNGNLQSVVTYAGGPGPASALTSFSGTFYYDGVNRLTSAMESGDWWRNFGYDQYGNMWATGNGGAPLAGNTPTSNVYSGNRMAGVSYDAAGNQLAVNGDTLNYDAENRMIAATEPVSLGGGTETYLYDGDGHRVEKVGPGGTTVYVYDALGRLAVEYSTAANSSPCYRCYLSYDYLGSVRMVTDQYANVVARHDFLPFGEEIAAGSAGRGPQWGAGNDSVNQKFTGKERDPETGMDYFGARYYGSALGRFTSPDWSEKVEPVPYAELENLQTLNLYAYARNNPLSRTDADGHCSVDGENHGWLWCAAHTVGLVQTQKEQADYARQSLSQMHGFTIGGQSPQDFAKNATNQQTIQGLRAADSYIAGQALSPCGPGVACGVIVPPGMAGEAGAVEGAEAEAVEMGAQSDFINITRKGKVANIQTNVSAADFGKNLESNGFTRTTASDGTPIYTKGSTQYTVCPKSNSTGGPTAQVKINGAVVEKIRLQ